MKKYLTALVIIFILFSIDANAARPMVTDDARLTKAGSCQVESWAKAYSGGNEFWALPACNPYGNFEMTLGVTASRYDSEPKTNDYIFQAKTLFKELETNGWSVGLALGAAQHDNQRYVGPNGFGSKYIYVPISHSFLDDKLITHVNLGYIHYKNTSKDSITWGVGGEYKVKNNLLYVLETFGDHRVNPFIQMGLRYSVVPDIFQVDTTIGRQLDINNSEWLSIGVRYTPDKFF